MPQKRNPDVLELVRARTARVLAEASAAAVVVKGLPAGYNRDLQETKEPFLEGLRTTRESLRILCQLVDGLEVNRKALAAGFTPDVFATDKALELVAAGMPFRDAYRHVKEHLGDLSGEDQARALRRKTHLGAPAGLDVPFLARRARERMSEVKIERRKFYRAVSRLLGVSYPTLERR